MKGTRQSGENNARKRQHKDKTSKQRQINVQGERNATWIRSSEESADERRIDVPKELTRIGGGGGC